MTRHTAEARSDSLDVCLACRTFFPSYSGPGERFRRYASGLRARGVQLRAFSVAWLEQDADADPSLTHLQGSVGTIVPPIDIEGIRVDRVVLSKEMGERKMLWKYFSALTRYLRNRPGWPNIVHFLTLAEPGIPCLAYLKWKDIPLVHTRTMVRDPSVGLVKNLVASLPYRFMDSIVVSSGVMRESIRQLGAKGSVEVIPNGVDLERFRPASGPTEVKVIRNNLGVPPSAEVVTFVGSCMEKRKGVDILAKAWKKISSRRPEAYLLLVGPGPQDVHATDSKLRFLRRIKGILDRSGAGERVIFTGRVEDVEKYFMVSDVFAFPSRREGMPNVVPEAFACGVASVLTPFIGFPEEFGQPGTHFLLSDHDPEQMARCVLALLENPELRRDVGEAGRRWVEEHLSLTESLDRYTALYQDLASLNIQ